MTLLLIARSLFAAEPAYALWDGHESVAAYAKKVNLPPTQTLDLGNGVNLELVLIPAVKFVIANIYRIEVYRNWRYLSWLSIGHTSIPHCQILGNAPTEIDRRICFFANA